MATEVLPIALDSASNIKIYEKLAPSHMINNERLEDIKEINHVADIPVGRRHPQITIERNESPPVARRGSAAADSIEAILTEGMARKSMPPSPPHQSYTPVNDTRSQASVSSPPPMMASTRKSAEYSPVLPRASSSTPVNALERDVMAAMNTASSPPPFVRSPPPVHAPVLPHPPSTQAPPVLMDPLLEPQPPRGAFANEYDRIRTQVYQGSVPTTHQYNQYDQRKYPPSFPTTRGSNYAELFHEACRTRQSNMGGGGAYRPAADPDYAEKKELLIKLDELRSLGFSIPTYDMSMPIEDLQSEVHRRTMSQGTISSLNTAIVWFNGFAKFIQVINDATGPFLPMDNYAKTVQESTSTPRFKYALYQIIMRWGGRSGMNPWTEIITIMLLPILEGIAIKFAQWVLKGRKGLINGNLASAGIRSLFSFMRPNPNEGVPTNLPGVSDSAKESVPQPSQPPRSFPTPHPPPSGPSRPNGAFGGNYPKAKDYNTENVSAQPSGPPPPMARNSSVGNIPSKLGGKKRLLTQQEIQEMNARRRPPDADEMSGLVITDEQRKGQKK